MDTRPHVMQVIWSLGLGGAEQVAIALASGLDARCWRVSVCCLHGEGAFAETLAARGVPVIAMRKRPKLDLALVPRLVRLMRQERVSVVQTHLWSANFWGRLAAAIAGVPVVVATEHGIERWRGPWHRLADRLLLRSTDRVVYVSEATRRRQVERGRVLLQLTEQIPNGVAFDDRAPASADERRALRARLGLGTKDRVVLFVGRLVPEKGLEHLLEAVSRLNGRLPGLRLLLVGSGPLEQDLQAAVARLGVTETVRFVGFQQDVAPWYAAADCLVLPSVSEALPMTVLEAMAVGLPVTATAVGDVPEILGQASDCGLRNAERGLKGINPQSAAPYEVAEAGLIVPTGDAAALAAALERLLTDAELAAHLGGRGRARVKERYTSQRMVERYAQLYETLLAQKGWTL